MSKMRSFDTQLIGVLNAYADDYGVEGLLDELVPGLSIGEVLTELYNAGGIPDDVIEKFLENE